MARSDATTSSSPLGFLASTHIAMISNSMTLSVVSHGHGSLLRRLLVDLQSCDGISGTRIIVTLNVSEPFDAGDFDPLRITVIRNDVPMGFGANHNQAFHMCETPWFMILNPDLRLPQPDCFEKLLEATRRLPEAALLAPTITNSEGVPEDAVRTNLTFLSLAARALKRPRTHPDTERPARRPGNFYWLAGMFLMVRSDVFSALGGFDERYFLYCEDYDLSARLYNAGHGIVQVSSVRAVHDAQRDSHRSFKHLKLHLTSLLKVWTSRAFWQICRDGQ